MRLLITGASGQLGAYLLRTLSEPGTSETAGLARRSSPREVIAWSGSLTGSIAGHALVPVDLTDVAAVEAAFKVARPDAVIHTAALARVADCHKDPERALRVNVEATKHLARLASQSKAQLVYVSTDLVFDGARGSYQEGESPRPLSVYGRTKLVAEDAVLNVAGGVAARISLLYGPSRSGRPSFFDEQIDALRAGRPITLFEDEWRTPLDLDTCSRVLLLLAEGKVAGTVHVGGRERMSRVEMGRRLAAFLGVSDAVIVIRRRADVPSPEPRPCDVSLESTLSRRLFPDFRWPRYEEALAAMGVTPATG
jgi:dTDP-4-dehydrorhamnose reductase